MARRNSRGRKPGTRRQALARRWGYVATLAPYAFMALLGLVVLILGVGITMRTWLLPFIRDAALVWNTILTPIVGEESQEFTTHVLGGVLLLLGAYAAYFGTKRLLRKIIDVVSPAPVVGVVDTYRRRQELARGPKIVALGGGTGLSTLLRGLKQHSSNITAIVCVSDDGGSSGRIVQEMGIIPPGDMRNCLVALADAEKLMTDLFQYRFTSTSGALSGHSLGNLLLAGLVDQTAGDVDEALKRASEVLNIRGRVVPATTSHVRLRALMEDGSEICGETSIVSSHLRIRRMFLDPAEAKPHPEAIAAIKEADIILVGPGSVYTSVIPNLLVPGIADAVAEADCPKVYICNVMTQVGESESFTAAEHVIAIEANVPRRTFDYVLLNTSVPSPAILDRYRSYHQELVVPDVDRIMHLGFRPLTGNFMSETDYVRHDPFQVASRLMEILR